MKKLLIIGAGGHGCVVADIAQRLGYEQIGFLDDNAGAVRSGSSDIPVVGKTSDAASYIDDADFFVAIGCNTVREDITHRLRQDGAHIVSLIHPQAVIAPDAVIGAGTVVMAGAVIQPCSVVGEGCIINTCASVDHDDRINTFCHISVGAHLGGTVTVGDRCFLGAGSTVINNVSICADVTVGAGGVVIRDIEKPGTYVGVPVRKIR